MAADYGAFQNPAVRTRREQYRPTRGLRTILDLGASFPVPVRAETADAAAAVPNSTGTPIIAVGVDSPRSPPFEIISPAHDNHTDAPASRGFPP
jgi:hypothetical protein